MKTYTKLDSKTMEVSEPSVSVERYEANALRFQIGTLQNEIARLQLLLDEAVKLGL